MAATWGDICLVGCYLVPLESECDSFLFTSWYTIRQWLLIQFVECNIKQLTKLLTALFFYQLLIISQPNCVFSNLASIIKVAYNYKRAICVNNRRDHFLIISSLYFSILFLLTTLVQLSSIFSWDIIPKASTENYHYSHFYENRLSMISFYLLAVLFWQYPSTSASPNSAAGNCPSGEVEAPNKAVRDDRGF